MKKRILAMLLCLSMAMQMAGYIGADEGITDDEIILEWDDYDDYTEEPVFDEYENGEIIEDDVILGEEEETPEAGEIIEEDDVILEEEPVEEEPEEPEEEPEEVVEEFLSFDSISTEAKTYLADGDTGRYEPQLMREFLNGNERYSIAEFQIDLFDYDPAGINTALNDATSDKNGFHFTGYAVEGCDSNDGINNATASYAKQGILANTLTNGLPVVNYLNGENAGVNTGKILFSDTYTVDGKEIYNDIPFEMIYDKQTGYYEYKSSANHAQLNDEKTKIELYTDTLSTENKSVATVNPTTGEEPNDFKDKDTSTGTYKATAYVEAGDTRLDPFVYFDINDIPATSIKKIYIRAKIPAEVGKNNFQLFFITDQATGYDEGKSFGGNGEYPYTADGNWIEFVINTEDNKYWKDKIKGIRIDLFDSKFAKGTLDLTKEYTIEISDIIFMGEAADGYSYYGGFYPFSEIQYSYPGSDEPFDYDQWKTKFSDDKLFRASRSIYNPKPNQASDLYEELAFGTVIEFDFYLPVDRQTEAGDDMTYYFNGDDDLWVFVDNELVLDIGGGHGAITGSVNFNKGTWAVDNAVTVTGYNSGAETTAGSKSGTIAEDLYSSGKHTMKIFYLERGGSVSNCYMKFNLPRIPQGSVVVSKTVEEVNNANTDVLMDTEFEFQISTQNMGADGVGYPVLLANTPYVVLGSNVVSSNVTTNSEGKFTLKSGETAYFEIDENHNVTVTEILPEVENHERIETIIKTSGNNSEENISYIYDTELSATMLTVDNTTITFEFLNRYKRLYGNLVISKTGISNLDHNTEETQSTIYLVSGTSDNRETIELEVVIVGNSQITVKDIPCGTYTVTEKTDWSWRYEAVESSIEVQITGGGTSNAYFENNRNQIYWLSGDSYADNWFGGTGGTLVRDRKIYDN